MCWLADLQVFKELVLPRDAVAGLVCTVPLVAMMLAVTEYGDQFSEIRDIKLMLQKTILPVIRKMPIWVRSDAQYLCSAITCSSALHT